MSREHIRVALITAVDNAIKLYPTPVTVEYENTESANTAKSSLYLSVAVEITESLKADLASTKRWLGMLVINANVRLGQGTSQANKLLDHLAPLLEEESFSGVRTYTATVGNPTQDNGRLVYPLVIPFWYDQIQ